MPKTTTESRKREPRSKEAVRTWLRLLSCESIIERHLRAKLRDEFSITLPQFDVLSELERSSEALTMSELSHELMVSNGNVTGVIDRLEKSGFIERERPAYDRRVQHIKLTKQGRKEFNKMALQHERWVDGLLSGLTLKDMSQLQSLLLKMRHSAE